LDNLQHIDELLRSSASSSANSFEVGASDWHAVEKKLRYRKNRIYAVWFFLALILVSSSIVLVKNTKVNSTITKTENQPTTNQIDSNIESQELNKAPEKTVDLPNNENRNGLVDNKVQVPNKNSSLPNNASVKENGFHTQQLISRYPIVAVNAPKSIRPTFDFSNYWIPKNINPFTIALIDVKYPLATYKGGKNNGDNNKLGYWEAGFSFTPSVSGKFISENASFAGLINRNYYKNVANNENAAFSNSAGLNIQYHLPSNFFIASGLFIAQRTESLNYNYTITETPRVNNNEITGYTPLPSASFINVNYNGSNSYHFVEIPLNLGYKQDISSKFELRGQLGMSYLKLFNLNGVKANYTTLEVTNLNDYAFNQSNLAANAKLGVYLNKERFTIGAEPIFNYNLTSLSGQNAAIKVKPYSYGFNISTNYKFKN
jgi:hypothetical protein